MPNELHAAAMKQAPHLPLPILQALRFYAQGSHFHVSQDQFDTVSGEPQNWLCHAEDETMIEDGTVARLALTGGVLNWMDGDESEEPGPVAGEIFSGMPDDDQSPEEGSSPSDVPAAQASGGADRALGRIVDLACSYASIVTNHPQDKEGKARARRRMRSGMKQALDNAAAFASRNWQTALKQSLWLAAESDINRYLDGAGRSQLHDSMCRLYLAVFYGAKKEEVRHDHEEEFQRLHSATRELTEHLDEVIRWATKPLPDSADLATKFFEHFHRLALQTLGGSKARG